MPSPIAQLGHTKIGGRQKGVKNKRTAEQLERIEYALSLLDSTIEEDLKAIEPKERAKIWVNLQEYIRPKLARTEISGEIDTTITEIRRTVISKKA